VYRQTSSYAMFDIRCLDAYPGRIFIAYSGGLDSLTLLHFCAQQAQLRDRLQAIYIDHGLQTASASWGEHCVQQAAAWSVPCRVIRVDARAASGESPEAAARQARYRAFAPLLGRGDVLLLAQHREDQMETFLLQLLRGSGLAGLAAMPVCAALGEGHLLRPLLDTAKQDIRAYATRHALQWLEDPSNYCDDFDRNFLRRQIVPLLRQRWPALDKTVARSAGHCREALLQLQQPGSDWALQAQLPLAQLRSLAAPQCVLILRNWLQHHGLRPPSQAQMRQIQQQFIDTEPGTCANIAIQQHIICAYRQDLYCLPQEACQAPLAQLWPQGEVTAVLSNGYRLRLIEADQGIPQILWRTAQCEIRPRSGGETVHLAGRSGGHSLKKLYQEAAVPPWQRRALPILYLNGRLAAVPGLWVDEQAWSNSQPCYRVLADRV
jgi:tRNA(Ile)-lysidine synthase